MATIFRSPRSYTGDDTVEISAHGSPVVIARIVELLLSSGCREANPGEFTLRAYLNGKMDLAQAEAVADIIDSSTVHAQQLAARQQSGVLSVAVNNLRAEALGVLARIEASIDFPEDVGELDAVLCVALLVECSQTIVRLISTADKGILAREGARVALVGKPNVGKSSLLNALLRTDRAIVTNIAGTTRDTLDESFNLFGLPVVLTDTAGIRISEDIVEELGIARTLTALSDSNLIVHVLDASTGMSPEDELISHRIYGLKNITVWNKADIAGAGLQTFGFTSVSASRGDNIEVLERQMFGMLTEGSPEDGIELPMVTHSRHKAALNEANEFCITAIKSLRRDLPIDFVSIEVQSMINALGLITGESAEIDVLTEIFSRFCIGK